MLVADYHAPDANEECVELLKQYGVKKIIRQKEVFQPELYFQLMSITPIGDLSRMTQYKSSTEEDRTAHLLTYPVLMAHDVAGYEEVLVGEDQRQHLEFARRLLRRANRKFGLELVIPTERIVVGRIRDLKRPDQKMSKSQPETCLFLDDTPDEIRRKIRKATPINEGYNNLLFLYEQFVGEEVPEQNSELKEKLSEALIEQLEPRC